MGCQSSVRVVTTGCMNVYIMQPRRQVGCWRLQAFNMFDTCNWTSNPSPNGAYICLHYAFSCTNPAGQTQLYNLLQSVNANYDSTTIVKYNVVIGRTSCLWENIRHWPPPELKLPNRWRSNLAHVTTVCDRIFIYAMFGFDHVTGDAPEIRWLVTLLWLQFQFLCS